MTEREEVLADTLSKQDEILSALLGVILKQREALKQGRLSDLQELMSEMRQHSVRAQAIETKRSRAAADVAAALGCPAVVADIIKALPPEDAAVMREAATKLKGVVERLRLEMSIMTRLMEEAKSLNEMMINEWRKLGEKTIGVSKGVFDARV
jgi:flagellar biosynthesis/type III secretory pathway chaperone